MADVVPIPAATVVVVRPTRGASCETLMVKRHDRVAFMAGAFVFPGGRVDEADRRVDLDVCCDGVDRVRAFTDLDPAQELVHRIAAIRELVEEAGVLIAREHGVLAGAAASVRLREALNRSSAFAAVLADEGLRLAVDQLAPIAHWVTPASEPRRYDTRFYLAPMPAAQEAEHDSGETSELMWITPASALARCRDGELMLPPPTWTTLATLATHDDVDGLLAWSRTVVPVRIQPEITGTDRKVLTLPGDPLHSARAAGAAPAHTRFVLDAGKGWRAVEPD